MVLKKKSADKDQEQKETAEKTAEAVAQVDTEGAVEEYEVRRVDLVVSRIEPWSVMKASFLLSFVLGIAMVLASLFLWLLLNSMHVFSSIQDFVDLLDDTGAIAQLIDYMRLPRVLALSSFVSVLNVILITALATIGAMVYNLTASLVGGIKVALLDE